MNPRLCLLQVILLQVILLSVIGSCVSAQQATSPKGFLTKPGNDSHSIGVFPFLTTRFATQLIQLDDSNKGPARTIKSLHLRRSDAAATPRAISRKMRFAVRMGHGDRSKLRSGNQRLTDALIGSWQDSMTSKLIQLPDMTRRPSTLPAPWSITLPFDRPFAYDGTNGLYIHINAWDTDLTPGYPIDSYDEVSVESPGSAYAVGRGCKIGQTEMDMWSRFGVSSSRSTVALGLRTFPAGPTSAVFGFIGGSNPNLPIAGFCAPLLATPDIVVPLPLSVTKIVGQATIKGWQGTVTIPYSPSLVGLEVFTQAWTIDATRNPPFLASHGYRTGKLPARPVRMTPVHSAIARVGNIGNFTILGNFFSNTAVVIGLGL